MSKDSLNLQRVLSALEGGDGSSDDALYSDKHRYHLLKYLEKHDEITVPEVDRVLQICSNYSTDLKSIPYVLSIISLCVKKEMSQVDYQKSALTILEILRLKGVEQEAKNIRTLALKILLSHSKSTLNLLVFNNCPVLIETFGAFLKLPLSIPHALDIQMEAFALLKLIKILDPQELSIFVKEGIPLWLSGVVPTIIQFLATTDDDEAAKSNLQLVQLLAQEMIKYDYFEYSEWHEFLGTIIDQKQIPASIKGLLECGKDTWYVIWIVIIKLLKNYAIRNYEIFKTTPINSMLPVVDTAFKMEPIQRVRSFACWNELIINFSNEKNPKCMLKRVKLLIVPLRLNNAKTEDVAQAKFNTWWLLIKKFKTKLDKLTNEILVPFLQFILGEEHLSKPIFWSGQNPNTRNKCLESFVEIVGHQQSCECTISIPHLDGKIINTSLIKNLWNNLLCALKTAIKLVSVDNEPGLRSNLRCIWMSFLERTVELPDNSVRREMFNDLINVLAVVLQDDNKPTDLPALIVETLVLPMISDSRINTLLNSGSEEHRPMHKVVAIIMDKTFNEYYKTCSSQELKKILDPIVSMILNESVATPAYMKLLLDELPKTNSSMKLWTALAQNAADTNFSLQVFNAILRWPLKTMHDCTEVKEAALVWYSLYNNIHDQLGKIEFDEEITKIVMKTGKEKKAPVYFTIYALIGVLKHKPDQEKMAKLDTLTNQILNWDYNENEHLLPLLVNTLVFMIDKVSTNMDETLAQSTINCVRNVFIIIKSEPNCTNNVSTFDIKTSSQVRENREVFRGWESTNNKTVLFNTLMSAMKTLSLKSFSKSIKNVIKDFISSFECPKKTNVVPKEFASPKLRDVEMKKKEPKIVKTFVENGEVYVEVKSNWKFNPKNLTKNQKENLLKKRDNIPALYQDLSQSQDDFKLTSWKTDSQDSSLSSSKSATSNGVSDILKNVQSADVFPKIMENFLDKNTQQNALVSFSPACNASPISTASPVPTALLAPNASFLATATPVSTVSPTCAASHAGADSPESTALAAPATSAVPNTTAAGTGSPKYPIKSSARISSLVPTVSPARYSLPERSASPTQIDLPVPTASPAGTTSSAPKDTSGKNKLSRMTLKDRISRNVRNLIEKSSLSPEIADQDHRVPVILIEQIAVTPVSNKISKNIISDKQESLTPNVSETKGNHKFVSTAKRNNYTPIKTVAKEDLNITNSSFSSSIDRPSRKKRKPKKYDSSVLLGVKKIRHSTPEVLSDSQNSRDNDLKIMKTEIKKPKIKNNARIIKQLKTNHSQVKEPEITVAQKTHMTNNGIMISNNDQIEKVELDPDGKAIKQSQYNKTIAGNEILDVDIIQCDTSHSQDSRETSQTVDVALISSTPFVKKNIEKSPEKSTSVRKGEAPDDKNKVSEGTRYNNYQSGPKVIVEVLPLETTPMYVITETDFQKCLAKNVDPQIVNTKKLDTVTTTFIRTRKTKASLEKSTKRNMSPAVETSHNKTNNVFDQKPLVNETDQNITVKNVTSKLISVIPRTKDATPKNVIDQQKSAKKSVASVKTSDNNLEIVQIMQTQQQSTENNKDRHTKNNQEEIVSVTPNSKFKDTTEKKTYKKSLIEKQLRIDTVEGHPLLKVQSGKRLTRKQILEEEKKNNNRRITWDERLNKSKSETTPKTTTFKEAKKDTYPTSNFITVENSQDRNSFPEDAKVYDPPCSEDIIESSQDSAMTTISVKSKPSIKRLVVSLEKMNFNAAINTQDLIQDSEMNNKTEKNKNEAKDIELSQNKLAEVDKNSTDLSENMDTEPMDGNKTEKNKNEATDIELSENKPAEVDKNSTDLTENMDTEAMDGSGVVEILNDTIPLPIIVPVPVSEVTVGSETQELAEADTQPNNPDAFLELSVALERQAPVSQLEAVTTKEHSTNSTTTKHCSLPEIPLAKTNEVSSPLKDDDQRKQDFLNDTVQISPIKIQSPEKENKSPSPETSSDYVVIRLSSPVHCDGQPYEKHGSPEFFSEDRVSPDNNNASPPRSEAVVTNTSPNSSLSLKKNRPQVRPSGRAAHMLGLLCVNGDKGKKLSTSTEPEEIQKTSTPAKRNLRILYNSVGDNIGTCKQSMPVSDDSVNFLMLSRALPAVTSSPSGPILKRKLADITDEATTSPASKRKRVSFHDPPVSTTISVHKYIDSLCPSPQSSKKRVEKQTRTGAKSPKRLENAFNLDTVLSNAVESFAASSTPTDDTQNISLDITPAVEVVMTSDLNDTDPICPDLVGCDDPIDAISLELSSPAMRELFVKELEGIIETIGDLAKMTELEVNRLCIKAPRIQIAKKVLSEYAVKRQCAVQSDIEEALSEPLTETLLDNKTASIELADAVELVEMVDEPSISVPMVFGNKTASIELTDAVEPVEMVDEPSISVPMVFGNKTASIELTDAVEPVEMVDEPSISVPMVFGNKTASIELTDAVELVEMVDEPSISVPMVFGNKTASIELTDAVELVEMVDEPSISVPMVLASKQTDDVLKTHTSMQTDDSKTIADIITACLSERDAFMQTLTEKLDVESQKLFIKSIPSKVIVDALLEQDHSTVNRQLMNQSKDVPNDDQASAEISFLRKHLYERYDNAKLILLCSQLLTDISTGTR